MRPCGTCTVCCTLVPVSTLNKPAGVACEHVTPRGCALFGKPERPPECAAFFCLYTRGLGDFSTRPDHSGYVMAQEVTSFDNKVRFVAYTEEKRRYRNPPAIVLREIKLSVKGTGAAVIATAGYRELWVLNPQMEATVTRWCEAEKLDLEVNKHGKLVRMTLTSV